MSTRHLSKPSEGRKHRKSAFAEISSAAADPPRCSVPPTPDEKARRLAELRAALADSAPAFQARARRAGEGQTMTLPATRTTPPAALPRFGRVRAALPNDPGLDALLADPALGSTAKTIAIALVKHWAWYKDHCWPGDETIAKKIGKSPGHVQRCLRQLELAGWIRREHTSASPPADGSGCSGVPRRRPRRDRLRHRARTGQSAPGAANKS